MRYGNKWPVYAQEWDTMTINSGRQAEFAVYANVAIKNKAIYQDVQNRTGVMWYHVAVLHRRESNADFSTYLGNGDPLNRVTTDVPKGRGPFASFADGAVDALRHDGLNEVFDWRLEKILYYCEIFNGTGYDLRGLPSPYLWGGTNIQKRGKYVADGRFDPTQWDSQPGCAPLLWAIAKQDSTVVFVRET